MRFSFEEVFKDPATVGDLAGFLVEHTTNTTNHELIVFAAHLYAYIKALPRKEYSEAKKRLGRATLQAIKHSLFKERMRLFTRWQRADPKNGKQLRTLRALE